MTKFIPTFLLKGLDPISLLKQYKEGYFNREISGRDKIRIIKHDDNIKNNSYRNNNNKDPIYSVKDKHNCDIIIARSGYETVSLFTKEGGKLHEGGRCDFCKRDFNWTCIGYPVDYKELPVLINGDNNVPVYKILYTFWMDGEFCSFECALAYIRTLLSRPVKYADNNVKDIEALLHILYKLMYPKATVLRPAQDFRLLKSNNGSLTKEQWEDPHHVYNKTDRIMLIPVTIDYVQQYFSNPIISIDFSKEPSIYQSTPTS